MNRSALFAVLLLFAICAANALGADDPQKQIEALQAGLQHSQQQTATCNLGQIQMAAEIDALRRKIAALEEAAKKAAAK